MSNYNSLKTTIDANIKQNGNQEITGQILNSVLNQMVNILGTGYQFAGVATLDPATDPGTPDAKVFYIANGKGTYTNFGGLKVTEDEVVVLYWDSSWHKVSTGIASQEKLTELENTQLNLECTDFLDFSDDTYTFDGYNLSINKNDTRSGNGIKLLKGVDYVISLDYLDANIRLDIIDREKGGYAHRIDFGSFGIGKEVHFSFEHDGMYEFRLYVWNNTYPHNIKNLRLWTAESFAKNKNSVVVDVDGVDYINENINRALLFANSHGFPRVVVPCNTKDNNAITPIFKINGTIKLQSDVELTFQNPLTVIQLEAHSDCAMVENAQHSTNLYTSSNIKITGGVFDGNYNVTASDTGDQSKWDATRNLIVGMRFAGVRGISFENVTIQNCANYGMLFGFADQVNIHKCTINVGNPLYRSNNDGIHFLGSSSNIVITDCDITSEDHAIALNADDIDHGDFCTVFNHIYNVLIQNVRINNSTGGQGINLLGASHKLRNITIKDITMEGAWFLGMGNFDLDTATEDGEICDVIVDNVSFKFSGPEETLAWAWMINLMGGLYRNISIKNVRLINFSPNIAGDWSVIGIKSMPNNIRTLVRGLTAENIYIGPNDDMRNVYILSVSNAQAYDIVLDKTTNVDCPYCEVLGIYATNNAQLYRTIVQNSVFASINRRNDGFVLSTHNSIVSDLTYLHVRTSDGSRIDEVENEGGVIENVTKIAM